MITNLSARRVETDPTAVSVTWYNSVAERITISVNGAVDHVLDGIAGPDSTLILNVSPGQHRICANDVCTMLDSNPVELLKNMDWKTIALLIAVIVIVMMVKK